MNPGQITVVAIGCGIGALLVGSVGTSSSFLFLSFLSYTSFFSSPNLKSHQLRFESEKNLTTHSRTHTLFSFRQQQQQQQNNKVLEASS